MAKMNIIKFLSDILVGKIEANNIKVSESITDSTGTAYPTETRVVELIDEAFEDVAKAENESF